MGAATSVLVAARDPSIAGMVLDSAFSSLTQVSLARSVPSPLFPAFFLSLPLFFLSSLSHWCSTAPSCLSRRYAPRPVSLAHSPPLASLVLSPPLCSLLLPVLSSVSSPLFLRSFFLFLCLSCSFPLSPRCSRSLTHTRTHTLSQVMYELANQYMKQGTLSHTPQCTCCPQYLSVYLSIYL